MPNLRSAKGELITDEMLEALSAEAEAGYDPATLRPRKVGRPSLGSGTSQRVQFRVDATLYAQAQERARAEQRTLSEIARALLEDYVCRRSGVDAKPRVQPRVRRTNKLGKRRARSS